jgi:hypothetical protein
MSTAAIAEAPAAPVSEPISMEGGFGDSLDAFFNNVESSFETEPAPALPVDALASEATTPAEATKEPTPSDTDPLSEFEDVKDWTPQAARRFKEVKAEAKQFKARAAELEQSLQQREARMAELEALANDPKIKDVASRAEEYEQAMILRNLESSSAYKQLVQAPLNQMVNELDGMAAKYSVDADALIDVVVMTDESAQEEHLSELLANASDRDKFRVYKIIEDVKPVLEQRRVLQENAQEALLEVEELERQRSTLDLADRARVRLTAATEVAKRIEATLPFIKSFKGVDLSQISEDAAKSDYTKLNPALGTYNTIAGRLLPKMATEYLMARKEIDALTERLAAYDKSGSPLNRGAGSGAGGGANDNRSFEDAVNAALGN